MCARNWTNPQLGVRGPAAIVRPSAPVSVFGAANRACLGCDALSCLPKWPPQELASLLRPDALEDNVAAFGNYFELPAMEQTRQLLIGFLAAFPDATVTFEQQLAEGDTVASRVTYRRTHRA